MDRYLHSLMVELYIGRYLHNLIFRLDLSKSGNKNKGKGNGVGLAWESKSHGFVNWFLITHAHSFGTDTQHDYSQGKCRTMSSIIIKLE